MRTCLEPPRPGEVLIEAREAKGLNQTQLAAALKRTQTFVSNYERGERRAGWSISR